MPDTGTALAVSGQKDNARLITWATTVFASLYFAWLGGTLYYATPAFLELYKSIGVELPLQARFLISFRWSYPLLYLSAIGVVIAKQYYVWEKWRNLAVTLALTAMIEFFSNLILNALYRPIFDMGEKLGK